MTQNTLTGNRIPIDNRARIKKIRHLLNNSLSPTEVCLLDESHLHAGHAGAKSGKGHFNLTIKSSQFEGLSTLKRHQLVYRALAEMMQTDIHALTINTSF